jgi:hypothetical protein
MAKKDLDSGRTFKDEIVRMTGIVEEISLRLD